MSLTQTGLQFSMTEQGNVVSSMLINQGFSFIRLNSFLRTTIMPLVASYGPWSTSVGLRNDWVQVKAVITIENDIVTVSTTKQTRESVASSVQLEELQATPDLNSFVNPDLELMDTSVVVNTSPGNALLAITETPHNVLPEAPMITETVAPDATTVDTSVEAWKYLSRS